MVDNHGDRKSPKDRVVVVPLPNGRPSWLINGGDPNHVSKSWDPILQAPTPKCIYMCQGLNSHYFHKIGDKLINPIVGVYIPIIRIPYERLQVSHPQYKELIDPGSCDF